LFDLGDIIPLTIEIRDANGALANAGGTVTLTIGLPDGTSTTPTVTNASLGRYQCDYIPTLVGRHAVRWVATGTNSSAYSDVFDVRAGDPGYIVSLSDAKRFLNIPTTNTTDDEELREYIESATNVIEFWRNETIVRRTIVDQADTVGFTDPVYNSGYNYGYDAGGAARNISLTHNPVISLTEVKRVDNTYTWNLASLDLDSDRGVVTVLNGPLFYGLISLTYVAGYSLIPANYTLAAKIIIGHLWSTQRQPSIGGGVFGNQTDSTPSGFGFAIPNRAAELLGGQPPVLA
jgi:hypothetical protein